jgi:probable H4MPT-linked C1 transfer pathway protein
MWRRWEQLAEELAGDLARFNAEHPVDALAVTMTGELADCFLDRDQGVTHIVAHACSAAARQDIPEVVFYGVDGQFHSQAEACRRADCIAAANWHALATYVGGVHCRDGLLIDIGSTTTDLIPLRDGVPATDARTDHDRLIEGSLVYLGGRRTPVATLVETVLHQGETVAVMKEWFATMDDVRLVLGLVGEDAADLDTADGQARTIPMAVNRLARMVGLDRRHFGLPEAVAMAKQVHRAASDRIVRAITHLQPRGGNAANVVISGHAADLVELPGQANILRLSDCLGEERSRCAPAVAVASLFLDQCRGHDQPCAAS